MIHAVAAVATFAIAAIGVPVVRRTMLRLAIVDTPNERSSHSGAIPRGGGIAVMLAVLVGVVITVPDRSLAIVAAGATALGVVGFLDDRNDLSVRVRLGAQLFVAASVIAAVLAGGTVGFATAAIGVVATIGFVAYVNAFNFMDGINGISAAQAIAAGIVFAVLGVLRDSDELLIGGLALAAAFLAFLPFNAPRAVIFLGDVGSYFAGFWIAGLVLIAVDAGVPIETALVPVVLWFADTGLALFIRVRSGERIGTAHSDHAYQRLARAWQSHASVAAMAAITIGTTSALAVLLHDAAAPARSAVFGLTVAVSTALVLLARRSEPTRVAEPV